MAGVDLAVQLGPVHLRGPVVAASGTAGYGRDLARSVDLAELGCLITKSVMLTPKAGRPTPRMAETTAGMLNAIGLQGPGIDSFLADDLPWLIRQGTSTAVSIAGTSVGEYAELAGRLRDISGVAFVEVNISCPNVDDRDQVFACRAESAAAVVAAVRDRIGPDTPVFAKLSADVTDIVAVATACVAAGADGLSLINTLLAATIDLRLLRPTLSSVTGGLSGPAIKPIAVRCIWQVRAALPDVPILGGGGVCSGQDALELVLAGANAVSVGTATFRDPRACPRIATELAAALAECGLTRLSDAVGLAHARVGGVDVR